MIGNGAYAAVSHLDNPPHDAHDMAVALGELGFKVTEIQDGSRQAMRTALEGFAGGLKKGDLAVVFYAGHGLQGPAEQGEDGLDNYLLPVDAAISRPEALAGQTLSLDEILRRIVHSNAGSGVVILDACRDLVFPPGAQVAHVGAGLAQPTPSLLRGVFIAFATAPGSRSSDGEEGARNGLYTGELLKRIKTPGQTLSHLFNDVGIAVEKKSGYDQSPWSSSTGEIAEVVLVPGESPGASGDELAAYRAGLKCDSRACFDSAISRVETPALKADLQRAAARLEAAAPTPTAAAPPTTTTSPAAATPAPDVSGLLPEAQRFVAAQSGSAEGRLRIAHAFTAGAEGLPRNPRLAFRWTQAAAAGGDARAMFELAVLVRDGLGATADRRQALALMLRAADAGWTDAAYEAARLLARGGPGVPRDDAQVVALLRRGAGAGDGRAMNLLATFLSLGRGAQRDPVEALAWLQRAAARGNPDALYALGACLAGGACGSPQPERALALWEQAASAGDARAALALARCHERGACGATADAALALRFYERAAELDSREALLVLARRYDNGGETGRPDLVRAVAYLRRGAELGDAVAMTALADHYAQGLGAPRNPAAVRFWSQEAQAARSEWPLRESPAPAPPPAPPAEPVAVAPPPAPSGLPPALAGRLSAGLAEIAAARASSDLESLRLHVERAENCLAGRDGGYAFPAGVDPGPCTERGRASTLVMDPVARERLDNGASLLLSARYQGELLPARDKAQDAGELIQKIVRAAAISPPEAASPPAPGPVDTLAGRLAAALGEIRLARTVTDIDYLRLHVERAENCLAGRDGGYAFAAGTDAGPCTERGRASALVTDPVSKERLDSVASLLLSARYQGELPSARDKAQDAAGLIRKVQEAVGTSQPAGAAPPPSGSADTLGGRLSAALAEIGAARAASDIDYLRLHVERAENCLAGRDGGYAFPSGSDAGPCTERGRASSLVTDPVAKERLDKVASLLLSARYQGDVPAARDRAQEASELIRRIQGSGTP